MRLLSTRLLIMALLLSLAACSPDAAAQPTAVPRSTQAAPPTSAPTVAATSFSATRAPAAATAYPAPPMAGAAITPTSVPVTCENPYYPLPARAKWTYAVLSADGAREAEQVWVVTKSGGPVEGSDIEIHIESGTSATTERIACSADGLQFVHFPAALYGPQNVFSQHEMVGTSGVYLPRVEQLTANASWSAMYQGQATFIDEKSGQPFVGTYVTRLLAEVVGSEQVIVPAGAFQALKIEQRVQNDLFVQLPDNGSVPLGGEMHRFAWFVKGVGLVKLAPANADTGEPTVELKSYNIP